MVNHERRSNVGLIRVACVNGVTLSRVIHGRGTAHPGKCVPSFVKGAWGQFDLLRGCLGFHVGKRPCSDDRCFKLLDMYQEDAHVRLLAR